MIDALLLAAALLGAGLNLWRAWRGRPEKRALRFFAGVAAGCAGLWHGVSLLVAVGAVEAAILQKLALLFVVLAIAAFGAVE